MKIQFLKTHEEAVLPARNNNVFDGTGDSGYDLYAVKDLTIPASFNNNRNLIKIGSAVVPVGLEVAYIEPGYWFRIEARSGLGFKHGIQPHFGIIDNQYRGDLGVKLYNLTNEDYQVRVGDKIAQMVIYKLIDAEMEFVDTKSETVRGDKGFGSSGR